MVNAPTPIEQTGHDIKYTKEITINCHIASNESL
jgi:hypothetical protein